MQQRPPHPSASRTAAISSVALTRATIVRFNLILTVVFILSAALLAFFSRELDRNEASRCRFLIETALRSTQKTTDLTIRDYAFWADAYAHLRDQVDVDWAYTQQNLGPTLFHDFDIQGVFVIAPDGRTTYAVIEGRLESVAAQDWLGGPIQALLHDAREKADQSEAVAELTTVRGVPAVVAAAALTQGTGTPVTAPVADRSVLLFVKKLDAPRLLHLGESIGLNGLTFVPHGPATPGLDHARMPGGAGLLRWDASRPGQQILLFLLPLIALAGLLVAAMSGLMLRRNTAAARTLDRSYLSLQRSQAALAVSEARFRDVAEASSDWIWETDSQGRFTYLSERFTAVTRHASVHWLNTCANELLHARGEGFFAWLQAVARSHGTCTLHCTFHDAKGDIREARVSARSIGDTGFRGTVTDVTGEMQAQRQVEYLSRHDVLTGLPNRIHLHACLAERLPFTWSGARALYMLNIDLDRFKPINDLLGHGAGDKVLKEVALRLQQVTPAQDLVARVGGDEFVMVVTSLTVPADIETLCAQIIQCLEVGVQVDGQEVFLSASIGIATAPDDASQPAELLRYSDIALYEAKAGGRGTWRFYANEMNQRILERRQLESDLRHAILHDELRLHFQPRYRVIDRAMVGAEALVRWQHPQRGLIAPDTFIPIAEEAGLISALSDWVMQAACAEATTWPPSLFVSVNLSSKEFQGGYLVDRVQRALHATGLDPHRLELEITETVMIEDGVNALHVMGALKALGIRLSMDDFGTGYSSLSYLRSFPFDGLKIDRSFVNRLGDREDDLAIIRAIIDLGRALSLTVTAEGVETDENFRLLQAVECDEVQGYLLSRPLDITALHALLRGLPRSAATHLEH